MDTMRPQSAMRPTTPTPDDLVRLRILYGQQNAQAQMDGQEFPSFEQWLANMQQPSMRSN